ncbi:glycosyltransferase [Neobacillus ginsengisoli]|uniref:GT2 family glycosyltransferase n=1 Tax=Neobacillus ginsengisoli TaxID=904295 RepID=A0ABT9XU46_9BACI|nr:glycosyltransferase [Neobacillus ginsengisoli]MDQ0199071.1 GT2 family glycosyltransferase [Neobacillus ginsengisoli]
MKITMVVVLYKQKPEESKTFLTLKQTLFVNKEGLKDIELILYDNSPEKQAFSPLDYEGVHITYIHDSRNLGIATAYNHAWTKAKENGSEWLLLLDHDTELTDAYVHEVLNLPEFATDVAAVVPKINSENKMISPVYSNSLRPLTEDRPKAGLQVQSVMAINSGALIRTDFLNKIGGFNENFPLDYLDHWLFFEIYEHGCKVWLLNVELEHELSVMDYSRVSLKRYQSILDSEMSYYQNYKNELYQPYRNQLAKRFLKQALTVKNKKIALYTLKRLFSM